MEMLSKCCFLRFPSGFKVVSKWFQTPVRGPCQSLDLGNDIFLAKEEERKNKENARKRKGKGKEEERKRKGKGKEKETERKRKGKGKIRGKEIKTERKRSPDANSGFIVKVRVAN